MQFLLQAYKLRLYHAMEVPCRPFHTDVPNLFIVIEAVELFRNVHQALCFIRTSKSVYTPGNAIIAV